MIRRILILTALPLTLGACAKTLIDSPYAKANAAGPRPLVVAPEREEYIHIGTESVTKIVVCRDGEATDRLEVTAPAHVTATTIQIIRPAIQVKRVGEIDCVAKLDVGVADYKLDQNNQLQLHWKSGWRKHYVMVGPEQPGLWQQIRGGWQGLKAKGAKIAKGARHAADAYAESAMLQAEMDSEMAANVGKGLKNVANKVRSALTPAESK